jgi:hypothetical protein
MTKIVAFLACIFLSLAALCQARRIDSLKVLLQGQRDDSARLRLMLNLGMSISPGS